MLRRFLPGVLRNSEGVGDVYVADNASTDDSLEFVGQNCPQCRIIRLEKNWGFAEGYNKALKMIDSEYYLLLNSDIEVTQGWLQPLLEFMDNNRDVAACQPKLRSIVNKQAFEYAGACGGFMDRYGYPFCRGRLFDTVEKDNGQYDDVTDIFWATGAALMVRSEDFWKCGALDGRFFAHNEEIDLCWRLHIMGRRIVCIPQSVVYHVGGGTLPKSNARKTFLNFRNNLTMLYKCLPERELRKVLFVRFLLDYVAAFKMLVADRNMSEFKAVVGGRMAFRRWKKQFAADRRRIQAMRTSGGHEDVLFPKSVVWQYYAKGCKSFSHLTENK